MFKSIAELIGSFFSRPHKPKGPDAGTVGESLTYRTEGTDTLGVHKFQWDWGDGTSDKWQDEKESHRYTQPGTYQIRVRERCPWWVFITRWSKTKTVTIQ